MDFSFDFLFEFISMGWIVSIFDDSLYYNSYNWIMVFIFGGFYGSLFDIVYLILVLIEISVDNFFGLLLLFIELIVFIRYIINMWNLIDKVVYCVFNL